MGAGLGLLLTTACCCGFFSLSAFGCFSAFLAFEQFGFSRHGCTRPAHTEHNGRLIDGNGTPLYGKAANPKGISDVERADVQGDVLRNLIGKSDDRKPAVDDVETASVPHTDTGTRRADGQLDTDGLVVEDLKEIEVDDPIRNRVELNVLNDTIVGRSSDFEVETVSLGGEDQLVQLDLVHMEVNLLGAAVEHAGNLSLVAQNGRIPAPACGTVTVQAVDGTTCLASSTLAL